MGISFRDIAGADDGAVSFREAAVRNNLSDLASRPFSFRELITPQYDDRPEEGRHSWSNWVGDHEAERTRHVPSTKRELVGALVRNANDGGDIRAVGAGHSHSAAPAPRSNYIDLSPGHTEEGSRFTTSAGLNQVLGHNGWLHDGVDDEHLVRLHSGVTLRRLNRYLLHPDGFALHNMGSFDGQTVAGAVNTSTHGTGIDLAAVSDSVKSVEIAAIPRSKSGAPIVRLYRIEPTNGITDREAFEADTGGHRTNLVQDDDVFHSVVVGYGCMGVVYAYTMEVKDSYWLREESELMKWSEVKSQLGTTAQSVREFATREGTRHLQILVNTAEVQAPEARLPSDDHAIDGDPICLVRRHYEVDSQRKPSNWNDRWPPERKPRGVREFIKDVANKIHPLKDNTGRAKQLHNRFFHPEASDTPFVGDRSETVWYVALRRIPDEGDADEEYYEPIGPLPTPTTEVAVPLKSLVDAVDAVLDRVQTITQEEPIPGKNADGRGRNVFFAVPMGIRFTSASEHFLSPEFGRPTAMVELPLSVNEGVTRAELSPNIPSLTQAELREYVVEPALEKVERLLVEEFDGRSHMGKHNTVTAADLDRWYPFFDASDAPGETPRVGWYQMYEHLNPFGTFDNAFTDQLDLEGFTPVRPLLSNPLESDDPYSLGDSDADDAADSEDDDTDDSSSGSTRGTSVDFPGFGVLTGAGSLGAAAWWLRRRGFAISHNGCDAGDCNVGPAATDDTTADESHEE